MLGVATGNVLTGVALISFSTSAAVDQYVVGVIKEFDLSCEATEGGVMLREPNARQKPSPVGEPCGSEDGAVEDGDEVPSEVGSNTPPVTLGREMGL